MTEWPSSVVICHTCLPLLFLPWLPSTPDLSTCPGRLLCPHLCPTAPTRHASALPHAPWPPPSGHKWGGGTFPPPRVLCSQEANKDYCFFLTITQAMHESAAKHCQYLRCHGNIAFPPPHGRFIPESLLRTLPETTCPSGALQRSPHPLSSTAVRPSFLTLPTQPPPVLAQGCSADPGSHVPLLLQGTAADFPASSMKPQPP